MVVAEVIDKSRHSEPVGLAAPPGLTFAMQSHMNALCALFRDESGGCQNCPHLRCLIRHDQYCKEAAWRVY